MLTGHTKQRQRLLELWGKKRLPQTLLFSGPEGIGKRLVAEELAGKILCKKSEEKKNSRCECDACRQLERGAHPDLLILDCLTASTDEVKELLRKLSLQPFMGEKRVTIINEAHELHTASANALLKTLEEPRPGNYFILVTHAPSQLPITIRSRAQSWFFEVLKIAELKEIALAHKLPGDAVQFADGSARNLFTVQEHFELYKTIWERLQRIALGSNSEALALAQDIAKDKELFPNYLRILRTLARRGMQEAVAATRPAHAWANLLKNSLTGEELLQRNLNPQILSQRILSYFAQEVGQFTTLTNSAKLLA